MLLSVENICKSYRGECVLHDVSFEIDSGEVLGLVGESGCGKSTLARQLCLCEKPTGGAVRMNGRDISRLDRRGRAAFHRSCQLILQDSLSSLDPTMTVGESLYEVLRCNSGLCKTDRQQKIDDSLRRVGLGAELLARKPMALSGGERQRINVCRALLIEPQLLICDEITSSLDVITQYQLLELLMRLCSDTGLSMLFISHDIKAVKNLSGRILVMHDGALCEELRRENGFAYSNLYTTRLFESLTIDHPSKRRYLASSFEEALYSS